MVSVFWIASLLLLALQGSQSESDYDAKMERIKSLSAELERLKTDVTQQNIAAETAARRNSSSNAAQRSFFIPVEYFLAEKHLSQIDPLYQRDVQETVQDAQTEMEALIPEDYRARMRSASAKIAREMPLQLRKKMVEQRAEVFSMLPPEMQQQLHNNPEQLVANMETVLSKLPIELQAKIKGMSGQLAEQNLEHQLQQDKDVIEKLWAAQKEVIESLPEDVKVKLFILQNQVDEHVQMLILKSQDLKMEAATESWHKKMQLDILRPHAFAANMGSMMM